MDVVVRYLLDKEEERRMKLVQACREWERQAEEYWLEPEPEWDGLEEPEEPERPLTVEEYEGMLCKVADLSVAEASMLLAARHNYLASSKRLKETSMRTSKEWIAYRLHEMIYMGLNMWDLEFCD